MNRIPRAISFLVVFGTVVAAAYGQPQPRSCWGGGSTLTFGAASSTACLGGCAAGKSCFQYTMSANVDCRTAGNQGCNWCVTSTFWEYDPGTSKYDIYDSAFSWGGGALNCSLFIQLAPTVTFAPVCETSGIMWLAVTKMYNKGCADINTAGVVKTNEKYFTIP